jgi:hypothetical protein
LCDQNYNRQENLFLVRSGVILSLNFDSVRCGSDRQLGITGLGPVGVCTWFEESEC